ncbi:FAD/NAD(P)-binding domain-containing protein [Aureobasidium namibiae CBS 147.97]|uniref:FAD/NAD(P)-binding domain-containing protein n=1 Tax=Aureobasidium namibiae CBS 147.97 TaxID=1043004 RepID=A0A074WH89_9PEZI|nr:FAD/NAD(P)-binding domain-containing protein [Aureobasidium namibiae CBS 147.97]KEQ72465.1 FAD/NAD(P)-binding domain-containing protein [Aureobasidium namibiae CBS 147.97]
MDVKTVAVIGAGVSGVSSAIHLRNAGLEVTVFERGDVAGDSPAFDSLLKRTDRHARRDSPVDQELRESKTDLDGDDLTILHAPPGPCYQGLHNNVSTPEMKLRTHDWKPNTPDFVTHDVLATYIQDTAAANDIFPNISFRTRVNKVEKRGTKWEISTSKLVEEAGEKAIRNTAQTKQEFDAVVVASGHYHAPNIPDYPDLKTWKTAFPTRIMHSKLYRSPSPFAGKNVLVIGAGVSSTDICRELGDVANKIWQSSRGGEYDLLPSMLPENCTRIGSIAGFSSLGSPSELGHDDTLPGSVLLSSGETINDVHHIILGTGYHMSYPFLAPYHADNLLPEAATPTTLVTTGQVTHNLHKDIFYIPDPTLVFIGVPYHVATFSLFEFQAMAVAAIFSGSATLPEEKQRRDEYEERVKRKGVGRRLHSLKDDEGEIVYAKEMMEIVNQRRREEDKVEGHTKEWFEAYKRRLVRMKERRGPAAKTVETVGAVEAEKDEV